MCLLRIRWESEKIPEVLNTPTIVKNAPSKKVNKYKLGYTRPKTRMGTNKKLTDEMKGD